jgi:hypothetical protein
MFGNTAAGNGRIPAANILTTAYIDRDILKYTEKQSHPRLGA